MVGMKYEKAKLQAKAALQQMITAARQYLKAEEILLGNSTNSRKRKNKVREKDSIFKNGGEEKKPKRGG